MLHVRGLTTRGDDAGGVVDLDLDVASGHVLALTDDGEGEMGAVLRCLTGAETPAAGTVVLDGRPWSAVAARSLVAAVPAVLPALPDASVVEHLDRVAREHDVEDAEEAVDRVLGEVGLVSQGGQPPHTLSTGQARRLGLGSAFVRPHRLLVLEEPERGLDAAGLTWLADRVLRERRAGVGVLLASHAPGLVERVADDVVHLG